MKKILYPILFLVFVAVAGITFLVIAAPTDLIRDQLVQLVKKNTGRDLIINGETSFSFFPNLGVEITKVSLSGPPSNPNRLLLKMDGLTANVSLLPLLSKNIEVNSFIMEKPVFDLWVDKSGVPSWQFAKREAGGTYDHAAGRPGNTMGARLIRVANDDLPDELKDFVRNSGGNEATRRSAEQLEGLFKDLRLEQVVIDKGVLRYEDQRTGGVQSISDVDVELGLDTLENPFNAEGGLKWKNERINFDAQLQSPKDVLLGRSSKLALNFSGRPANAKFNGTVSMAEGFRANGKLDAKTPALDGLLNWVAPGSAGTLGGGASVNTNISASPSKTILKNLKFELRGANGDGNITLDTGGARPNVTGDIHLANLDITHLLAGDGGPGVQPMSRGAMGAGLVRSVGELLTGADKGTRPGGPKYAQLRQGTANPAQAGWSKAPIDVAALKTLDSQIVLTVDRMNHRKVKMTNARLVTLLRHGILRINIEKLSLYGGRGTGRISVDGGRSVPEVSASMLVNGVEALPLLKDAADFGWIDGRGQLAINVAGRGRSENEIIQNLKGDGRANFSDGALVGVNIPAMVRSFQSGQIFGVQKDAAQKTDFSELSGTFTITNGVASNSDLKLIGPLIRLNGGGQVNLPQKSLDYQLKPKLVASLQGQGASGAADGLEIPFNIRGPWSAPSITPDLQGLLANPEKTVESAKKMFENFTKKDGGIKDLKKKIEGGDVGGVLKGLFGN